MVTARPQVTVQPGSGFGSASVDSMAMTKEGLEQDLGQLPSGEGSQNEAPFESSVEEALSGGGGFESDDFQLAPMEDAPAAPMADSWQPQEALLPSDEWSSESSAKSKQYLLVGFLGVGGVALAVIAFIAFLSWYGGNADPQDPNKDLAQGLDQPQQGAETVESEPPADSNPENEPTGQETESADPESTQTANPDAILNTTGANGDPDDDAEDPAKPQDPGAEPDPAAIGLGDPKFNVSSPFETEEDIKAQQDEEDRIRGQLSARMQQIADSILGADDWTPALPRDVKIGPAPVTAEDLQLGATFGRDPLPPVDWGQRQKQTISGVIFNAQQPLSTVLNTWTRLSGMPSRVDLNSLAGANLDVAAKLDLGKFQNSSVANISNTLAQKAKVAWQTKSDHLLLSAPEAALKSQLPESTDLSDLAENPEQIQQVLQSLGRLFPGTAKGWGVEGTTLKYDSAIIDLVTWFRAIRLIENLRVASGKTPGLTNFRLENLTVPFVQSDKLVFLDEKTKLLSVQEEPVEQAISKLCARLGVEVWFDWKALAKAGIGPETTALVTTYDRRPRNILKDFSTTLLLEFAIIDQKTIWVTSRQGYRELAQVFVIQSAGRTPEQWELLLEDQMPLVNGVGQPVVMSSFDGQHIITRCCYPKIQF